ncbi:MAG TPA: sugar-binding domain-containing protein, partial [Clostridia bacterium]|nr:sugar-binding domain-containing protein [Clostridia bacterium]
NLDDVGRGPSCLPLAAPLEVLVLPARGGIGRAVETQAGTLAAEVARKLGGRHRLLHMPDQVDEAARAALLQMPEFQETVALLHQVDVLLHGIGRADDMARHRHLAEPVSRNLLEKGAVAEAFGCFFDRMGQPVYAVSSVGLDPSALARIPTLVAVAAGGRKAEAIIGVMRLRRHALLITDEAAAREMARLLSRTGQDSGASL